MHWPDPAQRARIAEIRDNLIARIAEAEREGWLGEAEGLKISLTGASDKLAQIDRRPPAVKTDLGIPAIPAAAPTAQPMNHELSAGLRAHASRLYSLAAAAELITGHRTWLRRSDFTAFITTSSPLASIHSPSATTA